MVTQPRNVSFEERVARVLVNSEFITPQQLEKARTASSGNGKGLLEHLVQGGAIARETLTTVLSVQLGVPTVDLKHVQVDPEAVRLVPEDMARQHSVLPLGFANDGSLRIATRSPNDFELSSRLSAVTGRQIKFALALGDGLELLIDRTYAHASAPAAPAAPAAPQPGSIASSTLAPAPARSQSLLIGSDPGQLTAVEAVDMVTLQAVKRKASDLHLVPMADCARILFRIDGSLQEMLVLPLTLHETMISRIKVLAGMDISERRRPQDASFTMRFGERPVDFRVSTVGTSWGEMMVLRVLERSGELMALKEVGLDSTTLELTKQLLALPYGMLMVSGPTGSGKTTTLYAAVTEMIKNRGNIMTIEDPVEYRMENLNQIEVNRAAGLDFAVGLKSIMRLDPDVILVGEIRDAETARTAVDAALTGHLVLASIHANDSASALVRLVELGAEPYLVASSVMGSLAQRLVRKVCPHCRIPTDPSDAEIIAYEQEIQESAGQFLIGQGCNFCGGSGFSGRTGVFEVLPVREETRRLIVAGADGRQIKEQALSDGMITLRRAGLLKAKAGSTTIREVMRNVFTLE